MHVGREHASSGSGARWPFIPYRNSAPIRRQHNQAKHSKGIDTSLFMGNSLLYLLVCVAEARRETSGRPGGRPPGKTAEVIRRRFSQLLEQLIDLLLEVHHPQLAAHRQPG
jgi:hypothetical protein